MIVVIGGQCRNVGKTTLVSDVIRATRDAGWYAIKLTRHRHGLAGSAPQLTEELNASSETDTGRFLLAGARRCFWLRAPGEVEPAAALLEPLAREAPLIIESNSILAAVQPDLYYLIVDPRLDDFKESARRYAPRADALISPVEALPARPGQPVFPQGSGFACPDVIAAVAARLR